MKIVHDSYVYPGWLDSMSPSGTPTSKVSSC